VSDTVASGQIASAVKSAYEGVETLIKGGSGADLSAAVANIAGALTTIAGICGLTHFYIKLDTSV